MADPETAEAIAEEARRARTLRTVVDLVTSVLQQDRLTRGEAEALVRGARERALELFPDKASTYDLILAPRFARILNERYGPPHVLPFPIR
jgi:hypothetical protein